MYRIMIVEDDEKIASILRGYLERYGHEVFQVEDFKNIKGEVLADRSVR